MRARDRDREELVQRKADTQPDTVGDRPEADVLDQLTEVAPADDEDRR